jgi:hypothetical protein
MNSALHYIKAVELALTPLADDRRASSLSVREALKNVGESVKQREPMAELLAAPN